MTPALAALLKVPCPATSPSEIPSSRVEADMRTSGVSENHGRKPARQRVTMSRTARNLYASAYLKDHPAATTEEFDHAFRSLSDTVAFFNTIHEYAHTRPLSEPPDAIIQSFHALSDEERIGYEEAAKKRSEKIKEVHALVGVIARLVASARMSQEGRVGTTGFGGYIHGALEWCRISDSGPSGARVRGGRRRG
ncbi:hypothetical protein OH77DRAFT_1331272 [Trametes cingulata]|nr:hypothetical protein OH77DRAFT_1331272 [Trametes cingulata]